MMMMFCRCLSLSFIWHPPHILDKLQITSSEDHILGCLAVLWNNNDTKLIICFIMQQKKCFATKFQCQCNGSTIKTAQHITGRFHSTPLCWVFSISYIGGVISLKILYVKQCFRAAVIQFQSHCSIYAWRELVTSMKWNMNWTLCM